MLKRALAGIAEPTLDNPAARLAEPGGGCLIMGGLQSPLWRLCQQRDCWEFSWHAGRGGSGRGCCGATALTDKSAILVLSDIGRRRNKPDCSGRTHVSFVKWFQLSWGLGCSLASLQLGGKTGRWLSWAVSNVATECKYPKLVRKQGALSGKIVSLLWQNSKKFYWNRSNNSAPNFDVLVEEFSTSSTLMTVTGPEPLQVTYSECSELIRQNFSTNKWRIKTKTTSNFLAKWKESLPIL